MKRIIKKNIRIPTAVSDFDSIDTNPNSERMMPKINNIIPYSILTSSNININPLTIERMTLSIKNSHRNSRLDCLPTQENINLLSNIVRLSNSFLDLNGYSTKYPTYQKLKENLPSYRLTTCIFYDTRNLPIQVPDNLEYIQDFPLGMSMIELEGYAKEGMSVVGGRLINLIRNTFSVPIFKAYIPEGKIRRAIDAIKSRIQNFTDNTISELTPTINKRPIELPDYNALYNALNFHPRIKKASEKLFKDKHYKQAIFEAYLTLNSFVKEKSGKENLDGKTLMEQVFTFREDENRQIIKKPLLQLNPLKSQSDKDEQRGFQFLLMGAMQGIRNPKAHESIIQRDPIKTLEYLAFASLLARRIGEAKKNK